MSVDLESLLQPLEGDDPAGEDLAYDGERYQIEQAFERPSETGAEDPAAEPADVDWRRIIRLVLAQAEKTRDLWLAVYLARAGAMAGDLEVVEDGAQYLAGLMETLWDEMHPKLDDYGFQGRKGPCESLANYAAFQAPLRRVVLLQHQRLGRFTGADFERFRLEKEKAEGYGQFRATLEAVGDETLRAAKERLDQIEDGLRRTDAVLTDKAEGDTSTNFDETYKVLDELQRAVAAFLPQEEEASADEDATDGWDATEDEDEAPVTSTGRPARGRATAAVQPVGAPYTGDPLKDRADVLGAFDALSDYYSRIEPGSPVVLLLKRARQWVGLDFLAVLDDIAPSGLGDARQLLISRADRAAAGDSDSDSGSNGSASSDFGADTTAEEEEQEEDSSSSWGDSSDTSDDTEVEVEAVDW